MQFDGAVANDHLRRQLKVTQGRNVFADAGLRNPEVRLVRAELENLIRLETADATLAGAADHAGLGPTDIANIRAGQSTGLPLKTLVAALKRLGNDVDISVKVTKRAK